MKYCFLDLETTGFDPAEDSIIEISFIVCEEGGTEIDRLDEVVIPNKNPLNAFVTNITGITQQEIDQSGSHWPELTEHIKEKLGDIPIVGHNIDFDISFLLANDIKLDPKNRIDTHELSRIALINEESYSLEVLAEKYGFTHHSAHRAMSDVEANKDLFFFLLKKIDELPQPFLEKVRPFLEQKTDWLAKKFFLEASGGPLKKTEDFSPDPETFDPLPQSLEELIPEDPASPLLIHQGDSTASAKLLRQTSEHLNQNGQKVLIISPKLQFFPNVKKFPTPQVLLHPQRLEAFSQSKPSFPGSEVTFYLKCVYRDLLGYKGIGDFDLFFKEKPLWDEVNMQDATDLQFQARVEECAGHQTLAISPPAFFRFHDLELFADRTLVIDEAEVFAEKLLFAPSKEYSLHPYLENEDENISVPTQFFVTNFCQEVLEENLEHKLTPFPTRVLLHESDRLGNFAENLRKIGDDETLSTMAQLLEHPPEKTVRWVNYFPESGDMVFGSWHPNHWRELKNALGAWKKIFFYRTHADHTKGFFRIFLGTEVQSSHMVHLTPLFPERTLEIPPNLTSAKDPNFNSDCAQKILEHAQTQIKEDAWVAANFSSQETLKKVQTQIAESLVGSDITLLAERFSGGEGKVLQLLQTNKKVLLATQRMVHPALAQMPFKTVFVQKFPFSPPHPLLEEMQNVMKQSGQNFWNTWTMTQLAANLSRNLSSFPNAEKIILLDPRENAEWGRELVKTCFG